MELSKRKKHKINSDNFLFETVKEIMPIYNMIMP